METPNSHILDCLNQAQKEAVSSQEQHHLILAGAGSGKTRVLVHRIAWLIENENVSPFSVLAVTFTNKAAGEMKARVEQLINIPAHQLWIGTFHGLCHRILRLYHQEAQLEKTFQILDSADQLRIIKRIIKDMRIDDKRYSAQQAQGFINRSKDNGLRPDSIQDNGDFYQQTMTDIYSEYESHCQRSSLVDFAELLLRTYELLRDNESIRLHYQQRFSHILVDEFQDTNSIQYAWLKLLCGEASHLFVVGDDDQSIYGWRGAKIENIRQLSKDFLGIKTIRLEQNYRSTGNILSAANAIIAKNSERLGKSLWTESEQGSAIKIYAAFNDLDEARYIVNEIESQSLNGTSLNDMAILYRSNAQSRVLEDALIQKNMPYRIYGGQRFFDRAEIKDALAYIRLTNNKEDDSAFERIVNFPARGIGERTVAQLREQARMDQSSLWQATLKIIDNRELASRTLNALGNFIDLINNITEHNKNAILQSQVERIIEMSGLIQHYKNEPGEKGQARVENLGELVNAALPFTNSDEEELSPLDNFLAHAALEAGERQSGHHQDSVNLMTLHAAKGLEFPYVFIAGVEEGLFPHPSSAHEARKLEEERRLCYVGITRARQQLYMTHAERRRLKGQEMRHYTSRFINELPSHLLDEVRMKTEVYRPTYSKPQNYQSSYDSPSRSVKSASNPNYPAIGQRVSHKKFGYGMVLNYDGNNVEVRFDSVGTKWLSMEYAKLENV